MSFGLPYGVKEPDERGKLHSVNSINGERFVYYERLNTDNINFGNGFTSKDLYNKAKSVWDWRVNYGGNRSNISIYFRDLASNEFEKEKALLETYFKTSYDPYSEDCGKALIEAYNSILSTKEIFARNAALLANTNQTTLITHFPTYFDKAFQEIIIKDESGQIKKEIDQKIISIMQNNGLDINDDNIFEKALGEVYEDHISDIVATALDYMFNAKAEGSLRKAGEEKFNEFSKAYQEIAKALKEIFNQAKSNEFIRGMIKNYRLENFIEATTVDLAKNKTQLNETNYKEIMKDIKLSTKIKSKRGSLGGGAAELLGNFIAQTLGGTEGNLGSIKGIQTGRMGKIAEMKADYILLVGYDNNAVQAAENKLRDFRGMGRGTNVEDMKKFEQEMLEEFGNSNGFMIYVNSKNYTPNWRFKNGYFNKDGEQVIVGGYSAGSAINLETWDDIMHAMNIKGRDFIFTILQLIPGAIGSGKGKEKEVSDMFARAISSALFDDFEPADPYDKKTSPRVVHLLWLNGIYIPLSVFYTLLSKAFSDAEQALKSNELVEVSFKLPSGILYPNQKDQEGEENPWNKQSHLALETTTVSYHFLRGIQKFLQEFYKFNN